MESRDARMVSGFDLLGHNRTFQVHWVKRVFAFMIDVVFIFAPVWTLLYLNGERAPWVYGVVGGIFLYAYSTFAEAIFRRTCGKFLMGLEVRPLHGSMTLGKAAVRNIPKIFWFAFPLLDTIAGMTVDGDPRQRWSDHVLGTTVAQSRLLRVKVHRIDTARLETR
ncbi:MAG TPA: RDD family protein [Thermoplasmata archaeon]|nr:RDD family protein [Thermoplasmata archaeon]